MPSESATAARPPATWVSNTRSNSPAKCDTSVEVPPMWQSITLSKFGILGPERRRSCGRGGLVEVVRVATLREMGRLDVGSRAQYVVEHAPQRLAERGGRGLHSAG
ncbi:hypothetical protein W59_20738 [Rhodococcus opacus RKJ300 = JCM 13270]|uniref:Uncharacterized protein n=1 Tax=Rhodococcus opacus RKJ300 = JCM 13270 TaxID=1165867 RepID=I0WNS1_RHOOP|nr:hypothetical protein W59_20738 [Rhodococcus opacus RKJ300 = JCM 13270]